MSPTPPAPQPPGQPGQSESDDRVEATFNLALEHDAAERAKFIESACGDDVELYARVRRLLAAHELAGDEFDNVLNPTLEREFARLKPEESGEIIGNYKLREKLGEGGFGVVWVADQEVPVRRKVALKIIKLGMDTKEVIARFEQERQALALMDHASIAKVLDAGATPFGRPYFVMELVRGIKITDYCDQANLSTAERLALFITVCHAVQHAHQKGIIHRDLKPSNILVTLQDGVPVPKVIDFGVAKATQQQRLTDLTIYTQFEQMIGTPLYMSPEQAEMSGLDVDTRSDIYSLGVLLYELLTGRTPFDPEELMQRGIDEMRRAIREQEPQLPSTALYTMVLESRTMVAQHRKTDAAKLIHLIRGDLDWIVMKALEKDRTRRYDTANGLAADIQRHLRSEPVVAGPPSKAYRLQKFARRNKSLLAVAGFVSVVLLAATIISARQAILATRANELASKRLMDSEKARQEAEAIAEFMSGIFRSADPTRDGRTITVAEKLKDAAEQLESALLDQPELRARLQAAVGDTFESLGLPMRAIPLKEKVRTFYSSHFGEAHEQSIRAMVELASSYQAAGRRIEAMKLQEEALAISRKALGSEHDYTLTAMGNLANFYDDGGRNKEALKIYEDLLPINRRRFGPEDPKTLGTITNLAKSYSEAGRVEDAIKMLEEVLPIKRRVLGPNHPYTLVAMHALASAYGATGRREDSLKMWQQLLDLEKEVHGLEHRSTLGVTANLAMAYADLGRVPDAIRLLEEALPIKRRVLRPNDPYIGAAMQNLASCYSRADRKEDALRLRKEALTFYRNAIGSEHPDTLTAMHQLAHSYNDTGEREEGVRMMEEEVALSRKVRGSKHFETVKSIICLGRLYRSADRHLEEQKLFEEALAVRIEARGQTHADTIEAVDELANSLLVTGQTDRALELLAEYAVLTPAASSIAQKAIVLQAWFGKDAEFTATTGRVLELAANTDKVSVAYRAAKGYCLRPSTNPDMMQAALALANRAVELGEKHESLPSCQLALGMAEYRSGNLDSAEAMLEKASRAAGRSATVPRTAAYYRAMIRFQRGHEAEARELFKETEPGMKAWPSDEMNPMVQADANDVIVWMAYREAKALLQMQMPSTGTPSAK